MVGLQKCNFRRSMSVRVDHIWVSENLMIKCVNCAISREIKLNINLQVMLL